MPSSNEGIYYFILNLASFTEYFTPKFREDYLLADFDNARKYCQKQGGDLVEIGSAEEEERVKKVFQGTNILKTQNHRFWIGLSDVKKDGDFVWNSGARLRYSNFLPGYPTHDVLRNCIFMSIKLFERKWENAWCLNAFPFICERPYKGSYTWIFIRNSDYYFENYYNYHSSKGVN